MNPIQPIGSRPPEISVTGPVSAALERVKQVLFRPFDLGKWFVVGFCAWLALLGQQGGSGGGGNFNFGSHDGPSRESLTEGFNQAKEYVTANLVWIVPLAAAALLLVLGLWLLFNWLSSRGRFMFLHCVALNKAEVVVPWNQLAREANSLFWFRLGLSLAGAICTLPLVTLIVIMVIKMVNVGAANLAGVAISAGALLLVIALAIAFFVVRKLTMDFVVPIMFLRRKKCMEGWRELRGLFSGNVGNFILYFLFQIVLAIVIGITVVIVVIATCCIAGCFLAIPYLGTVLLLPVHVFNRAYSLYYLAQFGRDFDVFPVEPTVSPGGAPPYPSAGGMAAA